MNKKLGQEQAFPMEQHDGNDLYEIHHGMTKRFYAACAAMQGFVANSNYRDTDSYTHKEELINICYKMADELLKQENI